jgi:hypothetical protein
MRAERFALASLRATGGLLVWGAHFGVLYGATGLACARDFPASLPWTIGGVTLAAVAANGTLAASGLRADASGDILDWLAASGAALSTVAVFWQALPILMVPICG